MGELLRDEGEGRRAPWSDEADNPYTQPPRVLVVDDDLPARQAACDILARWGVLPLLAEDGAQAVEMACGHNFDLILMDLQMPVMDGLTAASRIRAYEREHAVPRAPLIAYTGSPVGAALMSACGIDAVILKPCEPQQLQECLLLWCPPW